MTRMSEFKKIEYRILKQYVLKLFRIVEWHLKKRYGKEFKKTYKVGKYRITIDLSKRGKKLIVIGKDRKKWLYALAVVSALYDYLVREALYQYQIFDEVYVEKKLQEFQKKSIEEVLEGFLSKFAPY